MREETLIPNAGQQANIRLSTLFLSILALLAIAIVTSLAVVGLRFSHIQSEIGTLRDRSLPRLIKLSQLSREASASIAIAPALSTNPGRFEFKTLLSRLEDKRGSQAVLLRDIGALVDDPRTADALSRNSTLLQQNQKALTTVVRQQIDVRRRLLRHVERLQKAARDITQQSAITDRVNAVSQQSLNVTLRAQSMLLDTKRARFSRNRREVAAEFERLVEMVSAAGSEIIPLVDPDDTATPDAATEFVSYWKLLGPRILEDKGTALTNDFKIKALVEENALLANRLISSTNREFARTNEELTERIRSIAFAARFNLIVMISSVVVIAAVMMFFAFILEFRLFGRLRRMRDGLKQFSDDRTTLAFDERRDEVGEIAQALAGYMTRISEQEATLRVKTRELEGLSSKLSKYLSPQVYDSIFAGRQQVKLSSSRKKLTVFFSDIVGFTERADHLESEELTALLNEYLSAMSVIALEHGATIDKFVGDSIMAFFGDPDSRGVEEDATRCAEMAIAMRDKLLDLNRKWHEAGIANPLECRIGIHTGYCTVGNFGSEDRMDYTIIGGTVNVASRLETAARPGQILISYETYALVQSRIDCAEEGEISVKGVAHPINTFSVIRRRGAATGTTLHIVEAQSGMRLEIDRDAMTASDRSAAIERLEQTIKLLRD